MATKQKILKSLKEVGIVMLVVILRITKNFLHGPNTFQELNQNSEIYQQSTSFPYMAELQA